MSDRAPFARFREKSGKSPVEVANLFGVNKATIFRWEKGEPHIPVKRLHDAERITGMSRRELRPDIFLEAAQ